MTADTSRIDGLYELAFRRHEAGELAEAEQLYRSILDADPRQIDCLNFIGMIALQSGRPADALEPIGKAIAANGNVAAYHGTIAEAYRALGRRDEAIVHYRNAVAIDPAYWAAHSMLADLLRASGDRMAAIEHYQKVVAAKPDLGVAHQNLAALLLEEGFVNEALVAACRALLRQDNEYTRALFVQSMGVARELPDSPEFRGLLLRALTEGWARPVQLAPAALTVVGSNDALKTAIAQINSVWPQRVHPTIIAPCMPQLMQDALLHKVMESTPVADEDLQRLLSCARTLLLDAALDPSGDIQPEMLPFACALARQCFINDYVFQLPEVERDGMMGLRGKLMSDLSGKSSVLAIMLLTYACYAPLHKLDRTQAILSREWPDAMKSLLDEQLREPEEEARLRAATPRLTEIKDETSIRVRQQYEENPYPRWTRPGPVRPASSVAAYLRDELGATELADTPGAPLDILIAGCGSGQPSIGAARRFPSAQVLAIDLSLASLGYAQRKAAEAGVTNLTFAQADILALDLDDRRFDLIEASGVLHHLADPFAGWTKLLALLKPGGFMRVGLYSELARQDIVAARAFIAAGGYDATADSIRNCRQNLIKSRDPNLRTLYASPDFYSISACRHLLFSAEEHRVTLPQIAAFLSEQGLAFLGFELPPRARAQYRMRFPEDRAMTDLTMWRLFEADHPNTFRGMYQFWVQRSA